MAWHPHRGSIFLALLRILAASGAPLLPLPYHTRPLGGWFRRIDSWGGGGGVRCSPLLLLLLLLSWLAGWLAGWLDGLWATYVRLVGGGELFVLVDGYILKPRGVGGGATKMIYICMKLRHSCGYQWKMFLTLDENIPVGFRYTLVRLCRRGSALD